MEHRPLLPDEFFGLLLEAGGGSLVGPGAAKASQGRFTLGGSLQVRLFGRLWLEARGDHDSPTAGKATTGGVLMRLEEEEIGGRFRLGSDAADRRLTLSFGGGYASAIDAGNGNKTLFGAPLAYGGVGMEHRFFGTESTGGYAGIEATYEQYFPNKSGALFKGGQLLGRVTFSYYFGGQEAADCW